MVAPRKFEEGDVLDRLRDSFWMRGFAATSLSDLEADTGLNRSSLYATYGDKTNLFLAALKRYGETISSKARKILANSDGFSAVSEMLRARARRVADPSTPEGCLMTRAVIELGSEESELGQSLRTKSGNSETGITAAVVRAQEQGAIDPSLDPQCVARLLAAVNHGMCVVHSGSGDRAAPRQIAEIMIRLLTQSAPTPQPQT